MSEQTAQEKITEISKGMMGCGCLLMMIGIMIPFLIVVFAMIVD